MDRLWLHSNGEAANTRYLTVSSRFFQSQMRKEQAAPPPFEQAARQSEQARGTDGYAFAFDDNDIPDPSDVPGYCCAILNLLDSVLGGSYIDTNREPIAPLQPSDLESPGPHHHEYNALGSDSDLSERVLGSPR